MDIIRRILVTGAEGYLGSLLAPELIRQGYEVIGLDTGFYEERTLYRDNGTTPLTLARDLRYIRVEDLKDIDAVVHMAELSNDPAGQLAPAITYEINHKGSVHLAELARKAGVKRRYNRSSLGAFTCLGFSPTHCCERGRWKLSQSGVRFTQQLTELQIMTHPVARKSGVTCFSTAEI